MLIRLEVSNILSFHRQAELHLVASRERIHADHVVPPRKRYHPRLLRTGLVYGANASGKSNLVKAVRFAQRLVLQGTEPDEQIPVIPFRLDRGAEGEPSSFEFEFLAGDEVYVYGMTFHPARIEREWLLVRRAKEDRPLFLRESPGNGSTEVEFGPFVRNVDEEERQFLRFVAQGTRPNQPFLTECQERNVKHFRDPIEWFQSSLHALSPDEPYGPVEIRLDRDRSFKDFFSEVLASAGTDISQIETQDEDLDTHARIPDHLKKFAREHVRENAVAFTKDPEGRRFALRRRNGKLLTTRVTTSHDLPDGSGDVSFELNEESDGTQRLFDLIPILYELVTAETPKVALIDEIGRSLHPHLVRMLFEVHLDPSAMGQRTQLIATTHDTSLLDLDLFRRDEIWFVEKDRDQSSTLFSLHDFDPRYDKDVRKDYMLGRYGGVPFLGNPVKIRSPTASRE